MDYRNYDSSKHDKCQACDTTGKGTTYMGMGGDHDGKEWTCSKCQGKGYTPKPILERYDGETFEGTLPGGQRYSIVPTPVFHEGGTVPPDCDLVVILRKRAGAAYAAGDDARAQRLRAAAEVLEEAAGLPEGS